MKSLQTNSLLAISLLINEDIYLVDAPPLEQENELPPIVSTKTVEINHSILPKSISQNLLDPINNDKPNYNYIGENNKSVLVLVNEENADILNNDDLLALNKLFAACKLELNEVVVLNTKKNPHINFNKLKTFFGFNKLLLFGINPKDLEIAGITANQVCDYKEVSILGTWHLKQMQLDEKKKRIFWKVFKFFLS